MRFGLIGTGFWARETHAAGLKAHPGTELAAVWGRSAEKTAALASDLGISACSSLDELLDEVEAVAIAVPPDAQAEFAAKAAARGRHLLLDKPLALDPAAADRVVQAVESAGVRAAVFFTMRYTDNIATWLAGLDQDGWYAGRVRIFTDIYQDGSPYAASVWRQERGALWDIGPHALSITVPIFGPVDAVVAQHGLGDEVDVGVHHASGATTTLSLSLTAPAGARGEEWQFLGASAAVARPDPARSPLEAYVACVDDLTGAVEQGRDPRCTVQFAGEVGRILDAAQTALDQGRTVRV